MITAKNKVFIGLLLESCYLVEEKKTNSFYNVENLKNIATRPVLIK